MPTTALCCFRSRLRHCAGLSVLVTLVLALPAVRANGQTDSCADAPLIGPGEYEGTTAGATNDGASDCGSADESPDVWFRIVPDTDCILDASSLGSAFDTVLAVHTGCPATGANVLVCNDDAKGVLQSRVSVFARAGSEYWLRVSGYSGAAGSYVLAVSCAEVAPPEQGDTCEEALPIEVGQIVSGVTTGSISDGAASCGQSSTSSDAWYSVTVDTDCFVFASTCAGADFDTVLSVHRGCPGGPGNEIECNDDACSRRSTVGFAAEAGTTYYLRVAGFNGASGSFVLELGCVELPPGDGPDMVIRDVDSLEQVGRAGERVGLSLRSVICNLGNAPVDWFANPDPRHPFLVFNAYRLRAGTLRQIGQSWIKHGFAASEESICGAFCLPTGGNQLGIGCGDVYGVETNAFQANMSPRHEVNPWNGEFTFAGSHIDIDGNAPHDAVEHRLELDDDDLDPGVNDGAEYFVELYVVGHTDVDHTNSLGHRRFAVQGGAPGGRWTFGMDSSTVTVGTIFASWPGAIVTSVPDVPIDDGRVYLAVRTTDNGDGSWHYEYGAFNLDLDRGVSSLRIPLVSTVPVTNATFHAVASNGEGFSNDPWVYSRGDDAIVWSTETFAENPSSNPLRWGTLYSFGFDAESRPTEGAVALELFAPGAPDALVATTIVPFSPEEAVFLRGDCDGDGSASNPITEALILLGWNFLDTAEPPCLVACDFDGNGTVVGEVGDAVYFLSFAFLGGPPPPLPFPECAAAPFDPGAEASCGKPPAACR